MGQCGSNLQSLPLPLCRKVKLVVPYPGSTSSVPLSPGNSKLPLLLPLESCISIENTLLATSCPHFSALVDPPPGPCSDRALKQMSPQERFATMSLSHGIAGDVGSSQAQQLSPRGSQAGCSSALPGRSECWGGDCRDPRALPFRLCASCGCTNNHGR